MSTSPQFLKIAALQTVSGPDVAANLAAADELIAEAVARGAQMVALPEYFALMSSDETAKVHACEQEGSGSVQDFLSETAARHGIWIVGGTLPLAADVPGKTRNAVLVFDSCGNRVARYDKIHLFGFEQKEERYDEAASIEAGGRVVCFDSPAGRVGLAVCYDLRFPELFRAMGKVDLIVLPAAFTYTTGRVHWEALLRARAIENQCYLAAAAQGGVHSYGRRTWGHSMIIDPWGDILACRPEGAGVAMAELDPDRLALVRRCLPALEHRRLDLFSS
ncbi:MAG: carbon-nitrogen hydrolase family protein [Betaproteobacteria bacterium]|nr:carbon-nitrogen hydrolase family protein [Betaproteobacteria bacterium]